MTYYIPIVAILFLVGCKKDNRALVVSKIRSVSKLATTETTIDKVVLGTQDKRFLGIVKINQARFVAYTEAKVKAGIDMTKMGPRDVKIEGDKIELKLPHVEVLNFSYPFNKYRIDSAITKNAFLNKMDIMDHEHFYRQAELDIRENLEYTGIIESTERRTRQIMEGLLKNLGYNEIYITFKEGKFITPVNLDLNKKK